LSCPRFASPKLNTLTVNRGEISSEWRPLYVKFRPVLPVHNFLWWFLLFIPVYSDIFSAICRKLVAGVGIG